MAPGDEKSTPTPPRHQTTPELPISSRGAHVGSSTDDEPIDHLTDGSEKLRVEDAEGHSRGTDSECEHPGDVAPHIVASPGHGFPEKPQNGRVSTWAKTACVVPRSERRGLLGRFAIIAEVESPHEYKNSTKWMITAIVALAAAAAPMGSGIFYRESRTGMIAGFQLAPLTRLPQPHSRRCRAIWVLRKPSQT